MFSFKLGSFKVVVTASADGVKEVLVTRSADYARRPPFHMFILHRFGLYVTVVFSYKSYAGPITWQFSARADSLRLHERRFSPNCF